MKILIERKLRYNGLDMGPGEVEVDAAVAQDWIKRKWAAPVEGKTKNNNTSKENKKNELDELYNKAVSLKISVADKTEYKGNKGIETLTALIKEAENGGNPNSGNGAGSKNTGGENNLPNSGANGQE